MIDSVKDIDISFDFTEDTPNYWPNRDVDPDSKSPTLQKYQQLLWSKKLPNQRIMELKRGYGSYYLYWDNFRFGSDSIVNMYTRHANKYMQELLLEVKKSKNNYDELIEKYIRLGYTIGGEIIFPKNGKNYSINPRRGTNKLIRDRFDLTVECIRRYYKNDESPLTDVLNHNKEFFDLFLNFKGYIDFFLLQDIVSDDYQEIKFYIDADNFNRDPYPADVDEWSKLYNAQMEFLSKRNERIKNYINEH